MSARLLTHDEVSALHDTGEDWSVSDDGDGIEPLIVDAQGYQVAEVDGFDTMHATDMRHARLIARAPALRATALDLFARLAAAHARIADLERLAAGPRTLAVDDGLARPFAPETLPGGEVK